VWVTDVEAKGRVKILAIPEPASVALVVLGTVALVGCGRRKR
jgi:hypothetical protein